MPSSMNGTDTNKRSGFTILELLVSSVIIAVLSTIGIISYRNFLETTRDTRRRSDLEQIRGALELYRNENNTYPAGTCGSPPCSYDEVSDALSGELVPDYLSELPEDPTDGDTTPYLYKPTDEVVSGPDTFFYGYCLAADMDATTDDQVSCSSYPVDYDYDVIQP